ncbi:MAG: PIN domain-containing protein, partial [Deltaproteobacteria bacterium]|nr:PIN domain-containing protein [Deltaproteobacteria bacterium]
MKKVYLDCNIILDWLMDRNPFSIYASRLVTLIETKKVIGYVSPLILANTYYILTKQYDKNVGYMFLKDSLKIFKILELTGEIVRNALNFKNIDFEDDLHYFTAQTHK